jgi:hypothetical protein
MLTKDSFLKDLEYLYQKALDENNLTIAFKIKELQGKFITLSPSSLKKTTIESLSDEELESLLKRIDQAEQLTIT